MSDAAEEVRESTPDEIKAAEAQGWRDDPEHPNFKPAWQFVEDGQKIAPIMSERNKKLEVEVSQTREAMEQMRADFFKLTKQAEVRGYEKAKNELEKRKERAYEDEDIDELKRIDREEKSLKPPEPPKEAPKQSPPDPVFIDWKSKNDWYGDTSDADNMAKTAYADTMWNNEIQYMNISTQAAFDEVDRRMKLRFGEKQKMEAHSSVETSGHKPPRKTGKRDYKSLPKDIKETFETSRRLQNIYGGNTKEAKEEYAKAYFSEYGEE